jgi:hypothetical protein
MAAMTDDPAVRFIQIHLGEVGIARERVCIDGFVETGSEAQARHFMKSWGEFDRGREAAAKRKAKN